MPNVEVEVTVEVTIRMEGREHDSVEFGASTVLPTRQIPARHIMDESDARAEKAVVAALNEVFREEVARLLKQTAAQAHPRL
jgi:hypothetical protein